MNRTKIPILTAISIRLSVEVYFSSNMFLSLMFVSLMFFTKYYYTKLFEILMVF